MNEIITRVRLLENGKYIAEVEKKSRFLFFTFVKWESCFYVGGYDYSLSPKKYDFEREAIRACHDYCEMERNKIKKKKEYEEYGSKIFKCKNLKKDDKNENR